MIATVSGAVTSVQPSAVVIEVGGVGLLVACTPQTAAAARGGGAMTLHTSLIVREESLTLYGFDDIRQRDAFDLVQTVAGIGPRTALAVLATLSPDELARAVAEDDTASLTRVPGIGTKGAQRMVIELRGRLHAVDSTGVESSGDSATTVRAALVSLGWSPKDADRAVAGVDTDAAADTPMLLREALRFLDRR